MSTVFAPYLTDIDEQDTLWAESLAGGNEMIGVVMDADSAGRTPAEHSDTGSAGGDDAGGVKSI